MPVLLEGVVNFPMKYAPWYIYEATLQSSPGEFTLLDILVPNDAGEFALLTSTDAVLTAGYAFALEAYDGVMTTVDVAVPGSIVPMISDDTIYPTGMVKFVYASSAQSITAADATDFAAGKVIGRGLNIYGNASQLQLSKASGILNVLTGCC
jgi:hypothetical protein